MTATLDQQAALARILKPFLTPGIDSPAMRLVFLLLSGLLLGCGMGGRSFEGLPATRVEVAGSVFDVRVRGELAEAIRVNPQYAPRFGPIRARAGFAMAQVSGCEVTGVLGDQAVATGVLDCGRRDRLPVILAPAVYSCLDINQWTTRSDGSDYVEFECDPI